ncbi:hypothetical protein GALL_59830 [mine drainage metagenome]|uniref:Uncharacterized protein n=1 Tax=mine drainage metagenome TaxID=410659 RepID=A0A1J5SY88_9ZZZZ
MKSYLSIKKLKPLINKNFSLVAGSAESSDRLWNYFIEFNNDTFLYVWQSQLPSIKTINRLSFVLLFNNQKMINTRTNIQFHITIFYSNNFYLID